jgi:hypothetical protein
MICVAAKSTVCKQLFLQLPVGYTLYTVHVICTKFSRIHASLKA